MTSTFLSKSLIKQQQTTAPWPRLRRKAHPRRPLPRYGPTLIVLRHSCSIKFCLYFLFYFEQRSAGGVSNVCHPRVSCHCCLGCGRPLILPNDTYDYTHCIAALLRYLQNLRGYLRAGSSGGVSGRIIVVIAQRGRPLIPYLTWLSYYSSCHFFLQSFYTSTDHPPYHNFFCIYIYTHTHEKEGQWG